MIVDVNVALGFWPFQVFRLRTPAQLDRELAVAGIGEAWVSAMESILYPDPDEFDERLYRRLRGRRRLRMVKTVNPLLGNWRASLREWAKRGIPAVKAYPNYHHYALTAPPAGELLAEVANLGLVLLVQMRVEDERSMNPALHVPGVPVEEVVGLAQQFPRARIVALCAYIGEARELARRTSNVTVDLAFVEFLDTVKTVLADIPADRLVFGSHTPFLSLPAELAKLRRANVTPGDVRRVAQGNARRLVTARA